MCVTAGSEPRKLNRFTRYFTPVGRTCSPSGYVYGNTLKCASIVLLLLFIIIIFCFVFLFVYLFICVLLYD